MENWTPDPNPITPGDSVGPYIFKNNRETLETLNTRAYVIKNILEGSLMAEKLPKPLHKFSYLFSCFFPNYVPYHGTNKERQNDTGIFSARKHIQNAFLGISHLHDECSIVWPIVHRVFRYHQYYIHVRKIYPPYEWKKITLHRDWVIWTQTGS